MKNTPDDSYSLRESQKINPLDLTNTSSSLDNFKPILIQPLNYSINEVNNENYNSSVYDNYNSLHHDEFGVTNNNIIPPASYRFESSVHQSNPLNQSYSSDLGITQSSIPPPPDYDPIDEEKKRKLLAELDDDITSNSIQQQQPPIESINPLAQSQPLNFNNNTYNKNIYPPDGLPVTMSPPPQLSFANNSNYIQESKYDIVYNNNKSDMKTTSSQIIEDLDVVMLPFKKKMIKQEMTFQPSSSLLLSELETNNNINNTIIDPPTLQPLDNANDQLPVLSQQLLINRSGSSTEPPDSMLAMKRAMEENTQPIYTANINPPIIQSSISLPNNNINNNNSSYLYPPNINPLQQSYDNNNVKEIDRLIRQLKDENDRITTNVYYLLFI